MLKKIIIILIILIPAVFCYGQSNFSRGEELIMRNQPEQALDFLVRAMAEDPSNPITYLYLGLAYEQLGRVDEAIAVYRRVLPTAGVLSANVANNLGNIYLKRRNTYMAEQYFTQALGFNSVFSSAYLGRANTRIAAGHLQNAVTDYEQYLSLEPRSTQREMIEQMIDLIRTEFANEEMRRIIAEEEARRIAEERQMLLESVSASLQSAAGTGQGLSFGTDGFELFEGVFELD